MIVVKIVDDGSNANLTVELSDGETFKSESAKNKYLASQFRSALQVVEKDFTSSDRVEVALQAQQSNLL